MTKQLIRLGIASLMVAGLASADTLYVNGVDTSLGLGAANNTNGWLRVGGADQDVYYYGAIDITIDGYARAVFCIDLFTDIYIGSTNSSVLTRPGTLAQGQAAWLLNEYWPETTNLPTVVVDSTPTTATAAEVGAAIQLGLWDVVQNNSGTLDTSSTTIGLSVNNTNPATTATDRVVAVLAQSYVTASTGQYSDNAYAMITTQADTSANDSQKVTDRSMSWSDFPLRRAELLSGLILSGTSSDELQRRRIIRSLELSLRSYCFIGGVDEKH
jgi:hypothetical protein